MKITMKCDDAMSAHSQTLNGCCLKSSVNYDRNGLFSFITHLYTTCTYGILDYFSIIFLRLILALFSSHSIIFTSCSWHRSNDSRGEKTMLTSLSIYVAVFSGVNWFSQITRFTCFFPFLHSMSFILRNFLTKKNESKIDSHRKKNSMWQATSCDVDESNVSK